VPVPAHMKFMNPWWQGTAGLSRPRVSRALRVVERKQIHQWTAPRGRSGSVSLPLNSSAGRG